MTAGRILEMLESVKDPEVPALSIRELGILRGVSVDGDRVRVDIAPTYSGCPALMAIETAILEVLHSAGVAHASVRTVQAPAWTTEWIGTEARRKLEAAGIAAPDSAPESPSGPASEGTPVVRCPYCGSTETELRSAFGSTPCKALRFCRHCTQPFEHFKAF